MSENIAVIGSGYVGLSNAILLSQNNNVHLFDINKEKIETIISSPIEVDTVYESLIQDFH